jgi:hypothetical protein
MEYAIRQSATLVRGGIGKSDTLKNGRGSGRRSWSLCKKILSLMLLFPEIRRGKSEKEKSRGASRVARVIALFTSWIIARGWGEVR